MKTLIEHIEGLRITQGQGAGEPFKVLPWQRRFLRGAFAVDDDAALSVARGNGKTTLCAAVAHAALDGPLVQARGEVVIVASSFDQARISYEHILAFLGDEVGERRRFRIWDSANVARVECRLTGARVRCASDRTLDALTGWLRRLCWPMNRPNGRRPRGSRCCRLCERRWGRFREAG